MISRRFSCVNGTHLQSSFLVSSSKSGATALQQLLADAGAASAAGGGARALLELRHGIDALSWIAAMICALCDAHAPADGLAVGHLGDGLAAVRAPARETAGCAGAPADRRWCAAIPCSDCCRRRRPPAPRRRAGCRGSAASCKRPAPDLRSGPLRCPASPGTRPPKRRPRPSPSASPRASSRRTSGPCFR